MNTEQPLWAAWAQDRMVDAFPGAAVTLALQMLQAAQQDDIPRARQIRKLLASMPIAGAECRILRAAEDIGRAFLQSPAR